MVLVIVRRRSELESKTCWLRVYLVLRTSGTTPSWQPHQSGRSYQYCRRTSWPGDVRLVVQRPRSTSGAERLETLWDSFNETAILSLTSELGFDAEPDCSPTTCMRSAPLFMTALAKISTSLLDVKHTRTQYDSLITWGIPGIEGSIIAQVTNDIEKSWKDMHSLLEKISNSGTLKLVLRFMFVSGGREGLRMKLTLFVSQASANFCDGP